MKRPGNFRPAGDPGDAPRNAPEKSDPAHHTALFSELVCGNSFGPTTLKNAVGLLKEEMRRLDSLIIACADAHQVPAGELWRWTGKGLPRPSLTPSGKIPW